MRSAGFRFFVVGFLALLMFIPLMMVSDVVSSRRSYSNDTIHNVGQEWGGEQALIGPVLVVPVSEQVTRMLKREVVDTATGRVMVHAESGQTIYETYEEVVSESRAPVYLFPNRFDVSVKTETELRHRGIFNVPVYRAGVDMVFDFLVDAAAQALAGKEELNWEDAELRLLLRSNRSLRGEAVLKAGGTEFALEPMPETAGIFAALGDPRGMDNFALTLGLNGAEQLMIAPVGRSTRVEMQSDWPDPSFTGAFLPDSSDVSELGFSASWTIPHLARALPQIAREDFLHRAKDEAGFGVKFYQPNDFYQKAWRAARYGILFIALTFLTVLLIESGRDKPVHPVQYILIGLAQSTFVLLMLAYAEQIGFGPAYLLSAGATIGLLVMFGAVGLKLGRRVWVLGTMLIVLYGVLYLILQSTDFALIAGATLAFVALGATMVVTRNEEWYGAKGPGEGFRRRATKSASPAPPTAED